MSDPKDKPRNQKALFWETEALLRGLKIQELEAEVENQKEIEYELTHCMEGLEEEVSKIESRRKP